MSTAMQAAFDTAGWRDPRAAVFERYMDHAITAWRTFPAARDDGARREHVRWRLARCDAWIVFEFLEPEALPRLLTKLLEEARTRVVAARAERSGERSARGEGHTMAINQVESALSAVPAAPDVAAAERVARQARAAARVEMLLSPVDRTLVDGRPMRHVTAGEVRVWAARVTGEARALRRDALFGLSLIANLPTDAVIGDYYNDEEEIERIYAKAEVDSAL